MPKVFISQPMKGKTTAQIVAERESVVNQLESLGYTVMDSVIKTPPADVASERVWCLGESLKMLSTCDCIFFMKGWEGATGCRIEEMVARNYGISCMTDIDK